jgi:hypothetical protein
MKWHLHPGVDFDAPTAPPFHQPAAPTHARRHKPARPARGDQAELNPLRAQLCDLPQALARQRSSRCSAILVGAFTNLESPPRMIALEKLRRGCRRGDVCSGGRVGHACGRPTPFQAKEPSARGCRPAGPGSVPAINADMEAIRGRTGCRGTRMECMAPYRICEGAFFVRAPVQTNEAILPVDEANERHRSSPSMALPVDRQSGTNHITLG